MKRLTNSIFLLLMGFVLNAQTQGELSVSIETSSAGGNYAPRNIVAIWIEDDAGNFVKTLLAYADKRKTHLNTWQASTSDAGSEYNTVDAITGATNSSHSIRTCTWNGTDFSGAEVTDGVYHVWMELTDKNSTGNYSSFSFTKANTVESLTPDDEASFKSISIRWEPATATYAYENEALLSLNVYPNPSSGIFTISGFEIQSFEVFSLTGELILKSSNQIIDLSRFSDGVYMLTIKTQNATLVKRLVKR